MKIQLMISGLAILFAFSSCKDGGGIFGNSKENEAKIASLERQNQALREELEGIEKEHEAEITEIRTDYEQKLADLQQQIEAGTLQEYDAYYVVVGSFKNQKYAESYAEKIRQMGYEGKMVPGPNNFTLVTSGTYNTLKSAIEPMREAREKVASKSWIYFKN